MADLFQITGNALKSAAEGTFKNPGAWLLMALLTAAVCYIIGLFSSQLDTGVTPVSNVGIILTVAAVLLTIIVSGACASFMIYGVSEWGGLLTQDADYVVYYLAMAVCWIIFAALYVIVFILSNPAAVRFGRTGKFSEAFKLTELMDMTQKVSWGKCILGTILQNALFVLLMATILSIAYLFTCIPVAGDFIGIIFAGLFIPFAVIFHMNFCARLYEGVNND